jgi:WD40 repeat protein
LTLRALLYLLPGLSAAAGTFVALLMTGHVTPLLAELTVMLVVLGLGVPPAVDWIRVRYDEHVRQEVLAAQRRQEWADVAAAQLRDHFGPRGRGILPSSVRSGSYFTGRVRVLTELAGWLADTTNADARPRVVTGGPGSGKSAVLGRLLLLADPGCRGRAGMGTVGAPAETVPPSGVISGAVHARGRTVDEVAAGMAQALQIQESGTGGLIAALRERWQPRPVVVLVDAVDEAADPHQLIVELLEPVASAAGRTKIRLLAGTRPGGENGLLRLFGASAVIVDLDSPANLDARDVEDYVFRTLVAAEDPDVATPYRHSTDVAALVARAVAARAGTSFLVAQLAALSLMAADERVDIGVAGWSGELPATVGAAMERYLREARPGARWMRDLLMALAWSQGDGLDDPGIWAAAATAVGTAEYSERDVARLLVDTSAVDLLQRTVRGDRAAFRLFHEALAEYLRQESTLYRSAAETQRRFTDVLLAHVPRTQAGDRDWSRADEYTRTYLPVHAAGGGALDILLGEAGFLATGEPGRLLAALPTAITSRGRQIARVVERVGQQLLRSPPGEQVCYLEMAARMAGDDLLAQDLAAFAPHRPWSVPWARWEPLADGRLLGHHDDPVVGVTAVGTRHGVIVVSASAWAIRAWSLADGSPVAAGLRELPSPVADMAAFADTGEIVVLTLHENGELRRTALGAAAPQTIARDLAVSGLWLISYDQQQAAVTTTRDDTVEVLSATDGHPVGLPAISISEGRILAAATIGERVLVAVGTRSGTSYRDPAEVTVWDLTTGTPFGLPFRAEQAFPEQPAPVWAATLAERGGHAVMLAGSWGGGPVFLWDPIQARLAGQPHYDHAGVLSTFIAHDGDGELQCWGDADGNLYLRSGDAGPVRRIAAHDSGIDAIAGCDAGGAVRLVTGGRDGAVRVWDPATVPGAGPPTGIRCLVVTPPASNGQTLIASAGHDGTNAWLDAADGQILTRWPPPSTAIEHIALRPGRVPAVVTADAGGQVALWRLLDDQPSLTWQLPADTKVTEIAVADSDACTLLLAAQSDGRLALFDVDSGQMARAPLDCHTTSFTVVTNSVQAGGPVQFATSAWREPNEVRVWSICGKKVTCQDLPIDPELGTLFALRFARLGDRIIIAGVGGYSRLHVWDASDGSLIANTHLEQAHGMALHDVDIWETAGQALVLCGGYTCSLALWPLGTGEEHHLWIGSPLWHIRSLPGDRAVVAGPRGIMAFQLATHLPAANLRLPGQDS